MHIMCAKERSGATVRMRVREIIKMHLDSGMIRLDTPVIIMDLPAGKKIEAGVMDPKVMEYMEREAGGCRAGSRRTMGYRRSSDGTGCKISDAADIVRCIESTG